MRLFTFRCLACLILLITLPGTWVGNPTAVQAALVLQEDAPQVYQEDFSTYQAKDFTRTSVWDPWRKEVRLQRSAINQTLPIVAAAPDGGVYAAYMQQNGIYIQRFDAHGSPMWPAAVQVYAGGIPEFAVGRLMDLAALPQGGAFLIWYNGQDLLAQRIDPDGHVIWDQFRVINAQVTYGWVTPCLSVYSDGSLLVAWNSGGVLAQRINSDGTFAWASPVTVAVNGGEQKYVAAGLDQDGNAVLAWYRSGNIFAQSLTPDGSRRWTGGDVPVNAEPDIVEEGYDATFDLGTAPDGSTVIVWTTIYNFGTQRIAKAQRLNASGTRVWPQDVGVSAYNGTLNEYLETVRPAVIVDATGGALVSFSADTPVQRFQYHAMYLTPTGQRAWAADAALTTDQPVNAYIRHTSSITPAGDVWVGWSMGFNEMHPYAQKITKTGAILLDSPIPLMEDTGVSSQTDPSVAGGPDGGAYLVWEDNRRGRGDVYITHQSKDGQPDWQTDIRVNGDDPHARGYINPRVAVDPQGNAMVVFTLFTENEFQMLAQKIDRHGNKLWPAEIAITQRGTNGGYAYSIAAGPDGGFVITWLEYRTQIENSGIADVIAQKIDTNGEPQWAAGGVVVNDRSPLLADMIPTPLIDGQNNVYIFWLTSEVTFVSSPINWAVYAQRLSADGARQWPADVKLSNASTEPVMWLSDLPGALFADGSLYVAWTLSSGTPVGRRILANGALPWDAPRSFSGLQPYSATQAPDGKVYVSGAISYQSTGVVVKIDDQGAATPTNLTFPSAPRLSYYSGGPVVAAYTSIRHGPDINVTSIEAAPNSVDWPVTSLAEPELFYWESGWVQSLTVDAVALPIRRAILTADSTANGGEILFSLSNDGGATWQPAIPGVTLTFASTGSDLRWRAQLIRDPVWPRRSPVIQGLRIAYYTEALNADRYEVDDTCQQATDIETAGVAQQHTFHSASDVDWVQFTAEAGQTYVIQASEAQANADAKLLLYDACEAEAPVETDQDPFTGNAQIAYTAETTGVQYVAVQNQGMGGASSGYALSVRMEAQTPVVIIVSGPTPNAEIQQALQASADRVYRLFRKATPRDNIRYLAADPDRDVDGNGFKDDIYAVPSNALLRDTIQDWTRERGTALGRPFYLFILADGQAGRLISHLEGGSVNPATLDLWLRNLESTSGVDQLTVVLEAPESGSFITGTPSISGAKRAILAAAATGQKNYLSADGAYFTDALLVGFDQRLSVREAFDQAVHALAERGLPQTPTLDDNGDGTPESYALAVSSLSSQPQLPDGLVAASRGVPLRAAVQPPVLDQLSLTQQIDGYRLTVRVRTEIGVSQVRLEAFPPGYKPGTLVSGATFTLQPTGSPGMYAISGLSATLYRRVVITARDSQGQWSAPQSKLIGNFIYLPAVRR